MIEQILNQCTVEGNNIKLPQVQLDRDVYQQVAKKLQKIGGRWKDGKIQAFVFDYDPTELLADLQDGKDRNIKKEFQFFESTETVARRIIAIADIRPEHLTLEPEAGRGGIIKFIPRCQAVHYYELNPQNREFLAEARFDNCGFCETWDANFNHSDLCARSGWFKCVGADFLQADESIKYDRIVANPPFSKNQDIDHIRKMYAVLADGGRLVSVASTHWRESQNRKETEFRNWLSEVGATVYEVEAGTFKESGTNISTVIIVIDK